MSQNVRELPKPTRGPRTHEAYVGDIINIAGGFTVKIIASKKLDHSLARIPGFKPVDGSDKVKIWICPGCAKLMEDEAYRLAQANSYDCPSEGCSTEIKNYQSEEI